VKPLRKIPRNTWNQSTLIAKGGSDVIWSDSARPMRSTSGVRVHDATEQWLENIKERSNIGYPAEA
jgi:hypothetical protein